MRRLVSLYGVVKMRFVLLKGFVYFKLNYISNEWNNDGLSLHLVTQNNDPPICQHQHARKIRVPHFA